MSDFKKQYKKPPLTFGKVKKIKYDSICEQQKERKKRRTKSFEENRKMKVSSQSSTILQRDETRKDLLKWKVEREKKKKEQESQKKPPFVVGIVRHNFYSPITRTKNLSVVITKKETITQAQKKISNQTAITKVTEKRLLFKIANNGKQKATAIWNVKKSPRDNCIESNVNKRESFAPPNHKFHPPAGLSTKKVDDVLSSNEFPTKNAIMETSDMPMEKEKYTVEYFKRQLCKEKNRLQERCKRWTEIQSQHNITEEFQCHINQAIGQTTLLLNKKFKKFYGLILLCEQGNSDMVISCTDLHGFWDTLYIEVKDCYSRFEKLENVRYWREEQSYFTNFAKKETDAKKQVVSVKQHSSQALISSDNKKEKMTKMQDNKEDPQQTLKSASIEINVSESYVTPSISNKKTVDSIENSCKVTLRHKCCKDLFKTCAGSIYTSTPFHNNIKLNSELNMTPSLVTMKISQMYNKSIQTSDNAEKLKFSKN